MYTALYRKWRPMTFDDVVSQPHITTTLSRQIAEGKTAHAYLFTGSRGTGKTTCARIFAKAINCLNPQDGKPCLECEICRAADEGSLNDIIEIDAASNTGVEDIRDLRESTVYTPEICRYKVYIIDEVHMLSNQAFNALLKIMEEPPAHVKFILATTEIHKVPATIISRCQRFDFRRIRQEDIIARLSYIAEQEGISLEPEAAAMIARLSDGAMRDALSLMDQCIAYSDNITAKVVEEAAGVAGRDAVFDILNAVADKNSPAALETLDMLYSRSKDMTRLCDELVAELRNIMLIKSAPGNERLIDCLPGDMDKLKALSERLTIEDVFMQLDILRSASEQMQRASSKRTELEMTVIKLCTGTVSQKTSSVARTSPADDGEISALVKRVASLEKELAALKAGGLQGAPAPSQQRSDQQNIPNQPSPTPQEAKPAARPTQKLTEDMLKDFEQWDAVLDRLTEVNPGCAGALKGSRGRYCDNILLIEVQSEFFLSLFKKQENASSLRDVVKEITGKTFSLRARCTKEQAAEREDKIAQLIEQAKKADIPVEYN
jgi:DNA polymerase-3 subunit gamma/tau